MVFDNYKEIAFVGTRHQLNILEAILRQQGRKLEDIDVIVTISDTKLNVKNELHIPPIVTKVSDLYGIKEKLINLISSIKSELDSKYISYFSNDNNLLVQLMINDTDCVFSEMMEDGLGSYLPRVRPFWGKKNIKSYVYHFLLSLIFKNKYKYNPRYYFGQYTRASRYWALSANCFPLVTNVQLIKPENYINIISRGSGLQTNQFLKKTTSDTLIYVESPLVEDRIISRHDYFVYLNEKFESFCEKFALHKILIKTHPRSNMKVMMELKQFLSEKNPNLLFEICDESFNFESVLINLIQDKVYISSLLSSSIFYSNVLFGQNERVFYLDGSDLNIFLIDDFQRLLKSIAPKVLFI
ncbi:alpha-2,8-polysialyltransferase family protein [Rahnella victoriana]|uniref:alpha-2,8-polysialyltransferase family protein n=1 Tax=Rahnella victoriana TaxID=1510570 RepID=UPI001E31A54A|nr:alpha-2,8-polysialyltransferase family protein [Rahnella victoriana]UHM89923.1 alpha-2,8-polysialyltransferase family protein [Rahnella victoriana]